MKKKSTRQTAVAVARKAVRAVTALKRRRPASSQRDGLDAFFAARDEGFSYSRQYMEKLQSQAR